MRKLVLIAALLLATPALAQQINFPAVTQSGTVTAGHPAVWQGNQSIQDGGGSSTVTTGTVTAAGFISTGSTALTNGMYLPATNSVGWSVNSAAAGSIDATGHWRIGKANTPTITSGACGTTTNGTIGSGNDQSFILNIGSATT